MEQYQASVAAMVAEKRMIDLETIVAMPAIANSGD
jgi:hypothetical protein